MGDPPPARDLRPHALLLALLAEVRAPRPHGDHDLDRGVERVQPHLAVAAERERPDVALAQLVGGDQLVRGRAQLLKAVGDRHVVQLGRLEQPLKVIVVTEDGRALRRVVRPLALEHAGSVVQSVSQYVYLRVLPGDELSVVPDEVRLFHGTDSLQMLLRTAWVASAVVALPPRSAVRRPSASARSTADSIAVAGSSSEKPWRSIIAADRNIASGLAAPVPAMSGADPWTGSNTPGWAGRQSRGTRSGASRSSRSASPPRR